MKRPSDNETTDPAVERELEALDAALAGLPVERELEGLAELVSDLRAERPEPEAGWAAELDELAAAGFRGRRRGSGSGSPSRLGAWLGSLRPGQVLAPAGALATLVMVVVVGVSVTADDRGSTADGGGDSVAPMVAPEATDSAAEGAGGMAEDVTPAMESPESMSTVPTDAPPPSAPPTRESFDALGLPGTDVSGAVELSGEASADVDAQTLRRLGWRAAKKTAPGADKRLQDRSAILALKTDTAKVREVSDEAIQITESVGGIVLSSNLNETRDRATATLELQIPTRALDATLDRLTDLATVASLNEAAEDITKPFVSAQDNLEDAEAERDRLLDALAEATDGPEADSIRAQLDIVRKEISVAEARFENIARQARLANVSLTIEGTPDGDDDGDWSLGDAADDALQALKTLAGVMLVGAAIVLPILALIALLTWLALAARRRSREKALDED